MNATYLSRDPLSLMPVPPGWRALYIGDDDIVYSEPLVGLAIYRITERPTLGSLAPCDPPWQIIEGLVFNGTSFESAEDVDTFWRYVSPDEAGPDADEVALEVEHRRRVAEMRAQQR